MGFLDIKLITLNQHYCFLKNPTINTPFTTAPEDFKYLGGKMTLECNLDWLSFVIRLLFHLSIMLMKFEPIVFPKSHGQTSQIKSPDIITSDYEFFEKSKMQ